MEFSITGKEEGMSALILVASGDPKRLVRLKKLVEMQGAVALTASDAGEAMTIFVRRAPDLTVLHLDDDIRLELLRDMKTIQSGRMRAVMVVASQSTRQHAFAAGCNAFIQRQTDPRPLERAVRGFLTVTRRRQAPGSVEIVA
jgi:DNA-binding response OmpR family regulator